MIEDEESETAVFTPKKSNLSRQAVEKNALRKSLVATRSSEHLSLRQSDDRPSYDLNHLNELRSSTPSTPKDLRSLSDIENAAGKTLDLASKFGASLALYQDSAIPTDAEIQEKKERRARLAQEEYIRLSDEDDNSNSLIPRKQKADSRLVPDDEDIAEGFDEFVEDGAIAVGRKAEREQKRRQKAEIRDMINEAEASSANESSDSEAERRAAYEVTQTRAGMDGLQQNESNGSGSNGRYPPSSRPRTPPKITPLPNLTACREKLRIQLMDIQDSRDKKVQLMEELQIEKAEIAAREVEIQKALGEWGERCEVLRREAVVVDGVNGKAVVMGGG